MRRAHWEENNNWRGITAVALVAGATVIASLFGVMAALVVRQNRRNF